jgi:hypothetical protein
LAVVQLLLVLWCPLTFLLSMGQALKANQRRAFNPWSLYYLVPYLNLNGLVKEREWNNSLSSSSDALTMELCCIMLRLLNSRLVPFWMSSAHLHNFFQIPLSRTMDLTIKTCSGSCSSPFLKRHYFFQLRAAWSPQTVAWLTRPSL